MILPTCTQYRNSLESLNAYEIMVRPGLMFRFVGLVGSFAVNPLNYLAKLVARFVVVGFVFVETKACHVICIVYLRFTLNSSLIFSNNSKYRLLQL